MKWTETEKDLFQMRLLLRQMDGNLETVVTWWWRKCKKNLLTKVLLIVDDNSTGW